MDNTQTFLLHPLFSSKYALCLLPSSTLVSLLIHPIFLVYPPPPGSYPPPPLTHLSPYFVSFLFHHLFPIAEMKLLLEKIEVRDINTHARDFHSDINTHVLHTKTLHENGMCVKETKIGTRSLPLLYLHDDLTYKLLIKAIPHIILNKHNDII